MDTKLGSSAGGPGSLLQRADEVVKGLRGGGAGRATRAQRATGRAARRLRRSRFWGAFIAASDGALAGGGSGLRREAVGEGSGDDVGGGGTVGSFGPGSGSTGRGL